MSKKGTHRERTGLCAACCCPHPLLPLLLLLPPLLLPLLLHANTSSCARVMVGAA